MRSCKFIWMFAVDYVAYLRISANCFLTFFLINIPKFYTLVWVSSSSHQRTKVMRWPADSTHCSAMFFVCLEWVQFSNIPNVNTIIVTSWGEIQFFRVPFQLTQFILMLVKGQDFIFLSDIEKFDWMISRTWSKDLIIHPV